MMSKLLHNIKLSIILISFAAVPALADRSAVIDKALDCVESNFTSENQMNWEDVCYMKEDASSQDSSDEWYGEVMGEHGQKVSNVLDEWEKKRSISNKAMANQAWNELEAKHYKGQEIDSSWDLLNPDDESSRENITANNRHEFVVGPEAFYANYEEPDVMEQKGTMWGAHGSYAYRPAKDDFLSNPIANVFKTEGMYAMGSLKYEAEGSSQTGLQIDKDDWMFDVRCILGKEYLYAPTDSVTFYSGFGYRYLNDDDDGNLVTVGASSFYGYEREANYYYIPVGLDFLNRLNQGWGLKTNIEYDIFIFGRQYSHLSDGNKFLGPSAQNEDLVNNQKQGFGLRGSLQFLKESEHLNVMLEPFVRFWHIEDSEVETIVLQGTPTAMLEPENETIEVGVKLGLQF